MPRDSYTVYIPRSVQKAITKIPVPWRDRIVQAFDVLQQQPYTGEKMLGKLADKRKMRVWPYRILYRVDLKQKCVVVVEVSHRGSVSYD